MKVDEQNMLIHTYYGNRTDDTDCSYLIRMADLLEDYFSKYETDACNSSSSHSNEYLEWRYDSTGHHVRYRSEHTAAGTAEFPDTVRNEL